MYYIDIDLHKKGVEPKDYNVAHVIMLQVHSLKNITATIRAEVAKVSDKYMLVHPVRIYKA